jgi:DNA-binding LytR/AlgR family response regulator
MEKQLESHGFVRCHRSYLVGLRHIRRIAKNCAVLDNGTEVPLSRSAYHKVNQAFIGYYRRLNQ